MHLLIVNGPNLNLLGKREAFYGELPFEDYLAELKKRFTNCDITYFQSNHEGELIDKLQKASQNYDGVVFNAGGYTHTSIALRDAIALMKTPVVEVHITDILNREPFRQQSYIAANCIGSILGFGLKSYDLGIQALLDYQRPNE